MNHDIEIDTRDHNCPVPILKAYQAIRSMNDNQVLKIVAAASSAKNFTAFADGARNSVLLHNEVTDETLTLLIQKTAPAFIWRGLAGDACTRQSFRSDQSTPPVAQSSFLTS